MEGLARAVGIVVVLVIAITALWIVTYPDQNDPKNMRYVLWKYGLATMNLDTATGTIEEDPAGQRDLILGKSPQQLRERFGFLLTPHQAGAMLEQCAHNSWADGQNPLYIRHTNMVVIFKNNVATETGILKPCP